MIGRRPPPWMPVNIRDLLVDTEHLPPDAFGAYVRQLCHMWLANGALPDDDRVLAKLANTSQFKWRRLRDEVRPFYTPIDGRRLTQKRLLKELWKSHGFGKKPAGTVTLRLTGEQPDIPGLFVAPRERARGENTEHRTQRKEGLGQRLDLAREAAARGELPPVTDELRELIRKMGLSK